MLHQKSLCFNKTITGNFFLQGGPERMQWPTINNFKKTREKMKRLCALVCIEFFSQQNDTKINDFDEGVLILEPCFWGNVIFKICHSCLKSHDWRTKNFYCLASPGKASALALESEDSMNKEKDSLRNFAVLQSGMELLKEIPPYLNRDFWYKRSKFLKLHCLSKMALESKCLHQNHWSWCHFAFIKLKECTTHVIALANLILVPDFFWN